MKRVKDNRLYLSRDVTTVCVEMIQNQNINVDKIESVIVSNDFLFFFFGFYGDLREVKVNTQTFL